MSTLLASFSVIKRIYLLLRSTMHQAASASSCLIAAMQIKLTESDSYWQISAHLEPRLAIEILVIVSSIYCSPSLQEIWLWATRRMNLQACAVNGLRCYETHENWCCKEVELKCGYILSLAHLVEDQVSRADDTCRQPWNWGRTWPRGTGAVHLWLQLLV